MRAYPLLNLSDVTPDPELVGQVPHTLASYYMALPLAREDGQVSVAMAHPENSTAVAVLSRLLGGAVVPVRGAAGAIRAALQTLASSQPTPAARILGWSERPEWTAAVDGWARVLGDLLDVSATILAPADASLDELQAVVSREQYKLAVMDLPLPSLLDRALRSATGPLLFVRGPEIRSLRRILVALRGFSSDEIALEWAVSLARGAEATLTLMSLASTRGRYLGAALKEALAAQGQPHERFQSRGEKAGGRNLRAYLKVRQGDPLRQVSDEAAEGGYDLILICAEGDGAFVGRILAELEQRRPQNDCPVLILKPAL
jgi:hypothetical protein